MIDDYYESAAVATYPVTLVEVKLWCKVAHITEDALLNSLITAATAKAELITNRLLISRTVTGYFSSLDCSKYEKGYHITIRRAPVTAVATVKIMIDDVLETIEATEYNLKHTGGFPRIIFEEVNDSPDCVPYPYQVAFTAGYGAAAVVPEAIKTAIKETITYWYRNRGDCTSGNMEIPPIAMGILGEYRILNTFA